MWSDMTYENILNDMLSRVSTDVDKREGSVIYDALAPAAYKLAESYFMLSSFLNLVLGDTAVGEYLDRVVADYGVSRKQATKAIRKIVTTGTIDIGTRWGIEGLVYAITYSFSDTEYLAECEQYGSIGNQYSGALENIDNVSGITATLTDIIESGVDTETDDNLRSRWLNQMQSVSTSGNVHDYRNWALDIPGVGDAKVFPLWDGPGTVKILIVDSSMEIDTGIVDNVSDYIETVRPVGASVTVEVPTALTINVTANISLDGTKTLAEVQAGFIATFTAYLKETVFEFYSVSYAKIGSLLLSTPGVADYNSLLVNDGIENVIIPDTGMPIVGDVTLLEVV